MFTVIRHHFEEIDSTNTWAKSHAAQFSRDQITLVTADTQTAGRGRFKRQWVSPAKKNIYATFCFFISKQREEIGHIPQVLALAARDILKEWDFSPVLKWPNDVLIDSKKIAGILCETVTVDEELCVVIGIGLNVNMSKEEVDNIDRPATSMLVEGGKEYSVEAVLQSLQEKFIEMINIFLLSGFHPFLEDYRNAQGMKQGDLVRFHDNLHVHEALFEKINDDGSLSLRLTDGSVKKFIAGEFITRERQ